jgi:BirA family transcriptional regulator, biotin operon repressor / biotin---[acetyl-CoA-carboxylase] ligase
VDLNERSIAAVLDKRPFRFFDAIGSTNDEASAWLLAGAPAGAVVIADEQTAGRGRLDRDWVTPPASAIAVSVVLKPRPEHLNWVGLAGAHCVAEALSAVGVDAVSIKWPNDVLIAGRKVAGILPQAHWQGDALQGVVLGIGINVRGALPESLAAHATVVEAHLPDVARTIDRAALIGTLLSLVDLWTGPLAGELAIAWRHRSATLGKTISVRLADGSTITGFARDVDQTGALLLETPDGNRQRILAGDVFPGSETST